MKKILPLIIAALILTLTACNNSNGQPNGASVSEVSGEPSTPSAPPTSLSTSDSASPTTSDGSSESAPPDSRDNASDAPAEKHVTELPKDFNVSDYITDLEDIDVAGCSSVSRLSFPQADEEAVAKAVEAYKGSYLYGEVVEELSEMYRYENGGLVLNEEYAEDYRAAELRYYIDETAAPELALKTETLESFRFGEESVIMLRGALPVSCRQWSGSAHCHFPVYVNTDGAAHILYDAVSQEYGGFELMYCNGSVYAIFNFGHNQGGQNGAVCSFVNGEPKTVLSGCPFSIYNGLLLGGYGWDCFEPYIFDAENGEFIALAGVSPGEELAEIICSDKLIAALVPDAREQYRKGMLRIIGGTYITFSTGIPWEDFTFVYNGYYKRFEHIKPVSAPFNDPIPEQITKTRNIKL